MLLKRFGFLALLTTAILAPRVEGHFLFVRVCPFAEGGRFAEVYFSEFAEAGDPRYIAKVSAGTTLRIQVKPGQIVPIAGVAARDRVRALVPATGAVTVYADCVYGVLPRKTPFLLRHFAKGIAGAPAEINAFQPAVGTPLEIAARIVDDGSTIQLTALREGRPVPQAEFTTIDADLTSTTLKSDETGVVRWTPPDPGRYTVTIQQTNATKGEHGGAAYDEIRDFATVAFDWPLAREGSDAEAVSIFEEAVANRAQWGAEFPGFDAEIAGTLDGREFAGTLAVGADGAVDVKVDDETAIPWLRDQLRSLVSHRLAPREPADRPVIRFADHDESHPLGRLLTQDGGQMASSYRIKDGEITSVNRHFGEKLVTIRPIDGQKTHDGRTLPRSYTVHTWNAATGALEQTDAVEDRWIRVESWDLPAAHLVTGASATGLSTRSIVLTKHTLRPRAK